MQVSKKIMFFLVPLFLIFLLLGCPAPQKPAEVVMLPGPVQAQQNSSVAKRFQELAPQGPTAIESAIQLSEKYAKLSAEMAAQQNENQNLFAENRRLKDQVTSLDAKLQQAQKELTQANDLLIEMRIELNNWKTDVLGFRDEMRDAEKAQLEALLKILKILGGEVKSESTQNQDEKATSDIASANKPDLPQPQKTSASGESDE